MRLLKEWLCYWSPPVGHVWSIFRQPRGQGVMQYRCYNCDKWRED